MESTQSSIKILIILGFFLTDISCQCSTETSHLYQEIQEENYDQTYHDISEPGNPRPLGFTRNLTIYNEEDKNPCISLDNVSDRYVEVMFEVIPSVPLCYRVNGGAQTCESSGRHQKCLTPTAKSKNLYEFFSDSGEGASESDVTFWYRLVRGPTSAEDPEDEFCMNRQNKFPGDLLSVPSDFTDSPDKTKEPNSAIRLSSVASLSLLCLLVHLLK